MFKRLFGGGKAQARRGDDRVWVSHPARLNGVVRTVASQVADGRSVVVVALSATSLDELGRALVVHQPARSTDLFGESALRTGLSRPGTVTLALGPALPAQITWTPAVPVAVLVVGRNDAPAADDAIVAFADRLGRQAEVVFHLSLDDPLMAVLGDRVKTLLDRLGMTEDEPIVHAMVTSAVRRAQEKRSG